MKRIIQILPVALVLLLVTSCSSVRVASDYDRSINFNQYKTFAFFKTGIDRAEINDIEKKRILRAIEAELMAKGFTKSDNPDMLVSIFTKSKEQVNVYNNGFGPWGWGYGWGWSPWMWNNNPSVTTNTQGVLYIDLIDANKKELIWQGMGTGYLTDKMEKKDERVKEFVSKIMEEYPPSLGQ